MDTIYSRAPTECWSEAHPMTKRECAKAKQEIGKTVSDFGLVVGTEMGRDQAIPYYDYLEGIMSLHDHRLLTNNGDYIPDQIPEMYYKYMYNEAYRVPLFELAFHDCAVATWYPADAYMSDSYLWKKRDLMHILTGTMPLYPIDVSKWDVNKERYGGSFKNATKVFNLTGYAEMIDHKYLTDDMSVQQSLFSNGVRVTVNFGNTSYQSLQGLDFMIEENVDVSDYEIGDVEEGGSKWWISLIVIGVLAVIGIAGFILYKRWKEKKENSISLTFFV